MYTEVILRPSKQLTLEAKNRCRPLVLETVGLQLQGAPIELALATVGGGAAAQEFIGTHTVVRVHAILEFTIRNYIKLHRNVELKQIGDKLMQALLRRRRARRASVGGAAAHELVGDAHGRRALGDERVEPVSAELVSLQPPRGIGVDQHAAPAAVADPGRKEKRKPRKKALGVWVLTSIHKEGGRRSFRCAAR